MESPNRGSSFAIVNNNGKQEIYVWGLNSRGQLGLGDTINQDIPKLLDSTNLGNYSSIEQFTMSSIGSVTAIVNNTLYGRQIYVWGSNDSGVLGLGTMTDQSSPILFNTTQFGNSFIKEINIGIGYRDDNYSSHAILSVENQKDKIYVWGKNTGGQLGINSKTNQLSPVLFDTTPFGAYTSIREFKVNIMSHAIVDADANTQKLFFWGANGYGQQGSGPGANIVTSPVAFSPSLMNNSKIKFVRLDGSSSYIVLTRNGIDELYVMGRNDLAQLGVGNTNNQSSPVRIPQSNLGGATEIEDITNRIGAFAQVIVNGMPKIYTWGYNGSGELGLGDTTNRTTPVLFDNSRLGNFTEFYEWSFNSKYQMQQSSFAYVKTASGDRLYTWGLNNVGQLGIGNTTNQISPREVTSLSLSSAKIKSISNYINYTPMLTLDRNGKSESYTTGNNSSGQIGIGTSGNGTNVLSFTPILPTRYTNPQPKLVNPTTNISSAQALELINPNNTLNRTELDKYVDTTSFPTGSVLSIDPTKTNADYKNGVLNLGIATNQYNDLLIVDTVVKPKTFNVTINGFRPVTDISTNPVTTIIRDADGTNIDKIYDQVVDSTYKVVNRNLLEYYFDLSSIPPNAVIHLYRTSFGNDTEATFTLTANQVYDNTGLIINQLYVKSDLVLTLTNQLNLALIISLSVVGGLLLIGSIVAIALVKRSSNKLII